MHAAVWHTPQPLWPRALEDAPPHARFRRPALLRFDSDAFMEEVQARLAAGPDAVAALVARAETWRARTAGWDTPEAEAAPVKLYPPAHRRYYLVAASLVCQVRGLPDRTVDVAGEETTAFVLRRLPLGTDGLPLPETASGYAEYGWFGEGGWKPVNGPGGLDRAGGSAGGDGAPAVEREERLPLFPLPFADAATSRPRRLLAGLVPVAGRETYEATVRADAPPVSPGDLAGDVLADPRLGDYERAVHGLLAVAEALAPGAPPAAVVPERDPFAFGLLDLVAFVEAYLPAVWAAVASGDGRALAGAARRVFDALVALPGGKVTRAVLVALLEHRALVESGGVDFAGGVDPGRGLAALTTLTRAEMDAVVAALDIRRKGSAGLDYGAAGLNRDVRDALGAYAGGYETAEPEANPAVAAGLGADVGAVYAVRCVYERPRCRGAGRHPVVSARSRPFRLAGFFDPDAPVRPARITLPVDTSVAGLRAFPKAVSFLVSNQLRAQLDRVQGVKLEALDKGEIGEEGGLTLGMICSLSIPIITLCAFVLLLVIVFVLNIVFWWLPFFRICFPIPLKK
jgi:hypothetical protein